MPGAIPAPTPQYVGSLPRWQGRRPTRRGGWILGVLALLFFATPLWHVGMTLLSSFTGFGGGNSSTSVPHGGTLTVSGNDKTQTIACNDGTLTVGGNSSTFTVTGHCVSLQVTGNDTHVTVDSADTITAGGIDTVTTYHSGTPKITKSGIDPTVKQG
jgi:hypothetical protein